MRRGCGSPQKGREEDREDQGTLTPKAGDRTEGVELAGRADSGSISQGRMEGTYGPADGAGPFETQEDTTPEPELHSQEAVLLQCAMRTHGV